MSEPLSILTATAHEGAAEAAEPALAGARGPGAFRPAGSHRELVGALGASPPDLGSRPPTPWWWGSTRRAT
ncbi:MAG: hypothetical protein ACYDA8_18015 [Deferrisomatales bacterium]